MHGIQSAIYVPWMIGMTTGEAAFKAARYLDNDGELAAEINDYSEILFPITMQYLWDTKVKHLNYISRTIRTRYFGSGEINESTANEMTSMYSDGLFTLCTLNAIHSYPGPKYVYLYNYRGNYSMSVQNIIANCDQFLGVSHADEVNLFFQREDTCDFLTNDDITFGDELIKRWINFANSSDPNLPMKINETIMSAWEPMTSNKVEYIFLDWNGTMSTDMYKEEYMFWKSLPLGSKYYENGKS
ncbi:venom carboxylesterase-6-like [Planococcus citri]|uniref:venom carboxylesterase-6-like n=1 Tax=Planococcus citri TaxID=170843 RepID=UPI0031F72AD0